MMVRTKQIPQQGGHDVAEGEREKRGWTRAENMFVRGAVDRCCASKH